MDHAPLLTLVERVVADPAVPDLSLRQIAVLGLVANAPRNAPLSVRELAASLKLHKPAITRAVDRLAELGFAVRSEGVMDRRLVEIHATPYGRAFLALCSDALRKAA